MERNICIQTGIKPALLGWCIDLESHEVDGTLVNLSVQDLSQNSSRAQWTWPFKLIIPRGVPLPGVPATSNYGASWKSSQGTDQYRSQYFSFFPSPCFPLYFQIGKVQYHLPPSTSCHLIQHDQIRALSSMALRCLYDEVPQQFHPPMFRLNFKQCCHCFSFWANILVQTTDLWLLVWSLTPQNTHAGDIPCFSMFVSI